MSQPLQRPATASSALASASASLSAGVESKPKDNTLASTLRHTAERRLSHRHNAPESFNLLVAGRRGVGKSTILQTICDSFHTLQIQSLTEGDKTIYTQPSATHKDAVIVAEAVLDPFCVFDTLSGTTQIRRCRVQLQDQDHETPLCVELVDTPGIDNDGSVNEISWEIERRLQNTLDDEMRPRREKSFHSAHIHAVIYVIPPPVYSSSETDSHCHRVDTTMDVISEIDIRAIRALGQFTSVLLAIGKSDTVEKSDRQVLKHTTYRFYSQVNELIIPTKLFDFTDIPGTQRESPEEVRVFGRRILREMPLFICGSKHVEEWQKMRLPEYLKTEDRSRSPGRGCVADWRSLASKHNRVRSRSVMITEGIFRNRKSSNPTPILLPADDTQSLEKNNSNEESISPYAPMATRLPQSLVMRSDTVSIQRYNQKREISLVREFGWGTLQLNNPEHCDFALLVDILFHSFRKSLTCWADLFYYERYRMQRIAADSKYFGIHREMSEYLRMEVDRRTIPVITKHRVVDVTPGEIRSISVVAKSDNNADVGGGSREENLDKVRVPSSNVDYRFGSPFTMPLELSGRENNFASNRGEFNFYYELPTTSSPTRSILPDTAASKQFYSTRTVVKSQKGSIVSSSLSLSLPLPLQPTTPLVSVSASGSNTASSNRSSAATAINTIVALFNPLINIKRHSSDNHRVKPEPVQVSRTKQRERRNTTSA